MAVDMKMPILIVDDYKTMLRIVRNLLQKLGFSDIDEAMDGTDALAKLKGRRYGLVISDWNMQPMTGFELLQKLRMDPAHAGTPFIMVTAESKTDNVIAARKAGVSSYIVKPFNMDILRRTIVNMLHQRETLRNKFKGGSVRVYTASANNSNNPFGVHSRENV